MSLGTTMRARKEIGHFYQDFISMGLRKIKSLKDLSTASRANKVVSEISPMENCTFIISKIVGEIRLFYAIAQSCSYPAQSVESKSSKAIAEEGPNRSSFSFCMIYFLSFFAPY